MYNLATAYGQRPSKIIGLDDEYTAYLFDRLVLQFGRWVEGKLNENDSKNRPIHRLDDLLNDNPDARPKSFRSVKGLATKRMTIPESGVW